MRLLRVALPCFDARPQALATADSFAQRPLAIAADIASSAQHLDAARAVGSACADILLNPSTPLAAAVDMLRGCGLHAFAAVPFADAAVLKAAFKAIAEDAVAAAAAGAPAGASVADAAAVRAIKQRAAAEAAALRCSSGRLALHVASDAAACKVLLSALPEVRKAISTACALAHCAAPLH